MATAIALVGATAPAAVAASGGSSTGPTSHAASGTVSTPSGKDASYVPLTPRRILDTRPGKKPAAGSTTKLTVIGKAGVPAGGVSAVVLNVTTVGATAPGFVTVWPAGSNRPTASNLNYVKGQIAANQVMVKVGTSGKVNLYTRANADLVVDVSGYFPSASSYNGLVPSRLLDTRKHTEPAARSTTEVTVTGRAGVPTTGVAAVVLNITAVDPAATGYVTVWPAGRKRPIASTLNYTKGQIVPGMAVAKVGTNGQVALYTLAKAHLVVDIDGWISSGGKFTSLTPARALDTRSGLGAPAHRIKAGGKLDLRVTGVGGVPTDQVTAVEVNVTVVSPSAPGWVAASPTGATWSTTSTVNFPKHGIRANSATVKVGTGGKITFRSSANTNLVVDIVGYFGTPDDLALADSATQSAFVGVQFQQQVVASGGAAPLSYTATGLPAGLSMSTDGTISGAATASGKSSPTVTVTDARGARLTASAPIKVTDPMPAECHDSSCSTVDTQSHTRQVAASQIGEITVDDSGTITGVLLTGLTPAIDDILVLAPTDQEPSGVIVVVTGVTAGADGTTIATVAPAQFADAYASGYIQASGQTTSDDDTDTTTSAQPMVANTPAQVRLKLSAASEQPKKTASKAHIVAPMASAHPVFSCDGTAQIEAHTLRVTPSFKPQVAVIFKHPFFGGGGIYLGFGGLDLFQFDLDGQIQVSMGASMSGEGKCTATFPDFHAAIPAGDTGTIIFKGTPTLTFEASGKLDVETSVTFKCGAEYRWYEGHQSRVSYCGSDHDPLHVTSDSGITATATAALDTSVSWNGVAGITGNITATAKASYRPGHTPVGTLTGKVTGALGGCLACLWKGAEAHVDILHATFFDKTIATWGSVPPVQATNPVITTATLPNPSLGQPYSQRLRTADNRNGTWSISSGSLPAGLTLDGDTISGKATTAGEVETFTVLFTDPTSRTARKTYTLTVGAGSGGSNGAIQDLAYCRATTIAANDDGGSDLQLPVPVHFGDQAYSEVDISNNGYVTFGASTSTYTPYPMQGAEAIVAPYFADIDTRSDASPLVTYGVSADGSTLCVNWVGVGYYSEHRDKSVSAQLLLHSTSSSTTATFNYGSIQWETGDASGGVGGIGGTPARAGWSDGSSSDSGHWYELPGSGVSGALMDSGDDALIRGNLGSSTPGRYVFGLP